MGRILPISHPITEALARWRARRDPDSPLVFHRDGIPVRRWRTAWRAVWQAAGVPTHFLHDRRRTAARNPPAPDVRRHATLPQSWIQRENWEFETHRVASGSSRSFSLWMIGGSSQPMGMYSRHSELTCGTIRNGVSGT